jgi:hypothetical protein
MPAPLRRQGERSPARSCRSSEALAVRALDGMPLGLPRQPRSTTIRIPPPASSRTNRRHEHQRGGPTAATRRQLRPRGRSAHATPPPYRRHDPKRHEGANSAATETAMLPTVAATPGSSTWPASAAIGTPATAPATDTPEVEPETVAVAVAVPDPVSTLTAAVVPFTPTVTAGVTGSPGPGPPPSAPPRQNHRCHLAQGSRRTGSRRRRHSHARSRPCAPLARSR